jgi:hypothetical protein
MMIPEPSAESLAADEQKFANTAADAERRRQYEAALRDGPPGNTPSTGSDPNAGPRPRNHDLGPASVVAGGSPGPVSSFGRGTEFD